jgi:hypothetical protein
MDTLYFWAWWGGQVVHTRLGRSGSTHTKPGRRSGCSHKTGDESQMVVTGLGMKVRWYSRGWGGGQTVVIRLGMKVRWYRSHWAGDGQVVLTRLGRRSGRQLRGWICLLSIRLWTPCGAPKHNMYHIPTEVFSWSITLWVFFKGGGVFSAF